MKTGSVDKAWGWNGTIHREVQVFLKASRVTVVTYGGTVTYGFSVVCFSSHAPLQGRKHGVFRGVGRIVASLSIALPRHSH